METTNTKILKPVQYIDENIEEIMYVFCKKNGLTEINAMELIQAIQTTIINLDRIRRSENLTRGFLKNSLPKFQSIQTACFEVWLTKALSTDLKYRHAYNSLAIRQNKESGQLIFPVVDLNGNPDIDNFQTTLTSSQQDNRDEDTQLEPENMVKLWVIYFEKKESENIINSISRIFLDRQWKGSQNGIINTFHIADKIYWKKQSPSQKQRSDLFTAIHLLTGDNKMNAEKLYSELK